MPLHLVLKSPVLARPSSSTTGCPIFGFFQMKQRGRRVPIQVVERLVEASPNDVMDTPDQHGCLPLHLATRHGLDMLKLMLKDRSLVHLASMDYHGRTPLLFACQHNCDLDVIFWLLKANPLQLSKGFYKNNDPVPAASATATAPSVAVIPQQCDKFNLTATLENPSSSDPVTWSLWLEGDSHSSLQCMNHHISQTTGKIDYDIFIGDIGHFVLIICAENAAGWSTTSVKATKTK